VQFSTPPTQSRVVHPVLPTVSSFSQYAPASPLNMPAVSRHIDNVVETMNLVPRGV
jgi:hypothetical protein